MAHQPGDVVEQHAVPAKEDGRPEDRVRHVAFHEGALDESLTPEVRKRRVDAGVGDADVHDPLDPRVPGRAEEDPRVLDRLVVVGAVVGEAHPIRVVQRGRAFERGDEPDRIIEVERSNVDRRTARRPLGMSGHGAHTPTRRDQLPGDGAPRIAERSSHEIEAGVGDLFVPRAVVTLGRRVHGASRRRVTCGSERYVRAFRSNADRRFERSACAPGRPQSSRHQLRCWAAHRQGGRST